METIGTRQEWFAELPIATLVVLCAVYQGHWMDSVTPLGHWWIL